MNSKNTVLIVDDDPAHRLMLRNLLTGLGYSVFEADDESTAIQKVHEWAFDLVLLDLNLIKVSSVNALTGIKAFNPAIPIIIITTNSDKRTAVETLKRGAYDYLTKPLDFYVLGLKVEKAIEHRKLKEENLVRSENIDNHLNSENIIGRSPSMTKFLKQVAQVAPSDATVLITGESGTGKEMIASAIHFNSLRKDGPFVKINCSAITEPLLQSELFGHVKGAFTDAYKRKKGLLCQAHKGSIFLDEISGMSMAMQVKLLRVIQGREVIPVGGKKSIKVDVRIIASTNKDLLQEIEAGRFREDLYYLLNVLSLNIPPLREKREDIPILAWHFLKIFSEKNRKEIKGFTPQAMDQMLKYSWPGNILELMNAVERGVVLSRGEYLDEKELQLVSKKSEIVKETLSKDVAHDGLQLEVTKKAQIIKTLELAGGNKSETARRLGITRRTLHKKLKKYGLMP